MGPLCAFRVISDHLGSLRLVVNAATGSVAQKVSYDAWGRVLSDSNPGFQPFGFAGGIWDGDVGLVRFGVRDYSPTEGRWTAKDPIGFAAGDTQLYAYAFSDPIGFVDIDGQNPGLIGVAVGGFVFGASATWQYMKNGCVNWDQALGHGALAYGAAGLLGAVIRGLAGGVGPLASRGRTIKQAWLGDGVAEAFDPVTGATYISRQGVRDFAATTGNSIRTELYRTAYHEAFHRGFYPLARVANRIAGRDLYSTSKRWRATEEALAEGYGRARAFLREYFGIR